MNGPRGDTQRYPMIPILHNVGWAPVSVTNTRLAIFWRLGQDRTHPSLELRLRKVTPGHEFFFLRFLPSSLVLLSCLPSPYMCVCVCVPKLLCERQKIEKRSAGPLAHLYLWMDRQMGWATTWMISEQ